MATTSSPDSDVSSTTVQVTSLGAGQQIFQSGGQQYLIVNKALQGSGGRIQIVDNQQESARESDAVRIRRELLARQPSYCKILNDLKEVESSESEDQEIPAEVTEKQEKEEVNGHDLVMKGETIEVVEGAPQSTQTVVINGQAYQIVTPVNLVSSNISVATAANVVTSPQSVTNVQYTSSGTNGSSTGSVYLSGGAGTTSSQQIVSVQNNGTNGSPEEEQARKRENRLRKNREAARECRNKKKEYIKCLENRVAVLESQNKTLIEELKSLKELYTHQKN